MSDVAQYQGETVIHLYPSSTMAIKKIRECAQLLWERPMFLVRGFPRLSNMKFNCRAVINFCSTATEFYERFEPTVKKRSSSAGEVEVKTHSHTCGKVKAFPKVFSFAFEWDRSSLKLTESFGSCGSQNPYGSVQLSPTEWDDVHDNICVELLYYFKGYPP